MPIFDYHCDTCGMVAERFVKVPTETVWCPKCDFPMRKEIGLSNFHLKGDGWFKDGYTKKKGPKAP
jgi:putative FmdB family regulatory protein